LRVLLEWPEVGPFADELSRTGALDPLLPFTDGRYLEAGLHAVATR
jgi:hypothetical protein